MKIRSDHFPASAPPSQGVTSTLTGSLEQLAGRPANIRAQNALDRKRQRTEQMATGHNSDQDGGSSPKAVPKVYKDDSDPSDNDVVAAHIHNATSPASKKPLASAPTSAPVADAPAAPEPGAPSTLSAKQETDVKTKNANAKTEQGRSKTNPKSDKAEGTSKAPAGAGTTSTSGADAQEGPSKKRGRGKSEAAELHEEQEEEEDTADEERTDIDDELTEDLVMSCQDILYPKWMLQNTMEARKRSKDLLRHEMLMTAGVLVNNKQEKFLIKPEAHPKLPQVQSSSCFMVVASNTQDPDTREDTKTIVFDDMTKPVARYETYGVFIIAAEGRQLKTKPGRPPRSKHETWAVPVTHGALCTLPLSYIWFGLYDGTADEPWAYLNLYVAGEDYEQMEAITLSKKGRHKRQPFMKFLAERQEEDGQSEIRGANILWRRPNQQDSNCPDQSYDTLELRDCHPDNPLFALFVTQVINTAEFPTEPVLPLVAEGQRAPADLSSLYQ